MLCKGGLLRQILTVSNHTQVTRLLRGTTMKIARRQESTKTELPAHPLMQMLLYELLKHGPKKLSVRPNRGPTISARRVRQDNCCCLLYCTSDTGCRQSAENTHYPPLISPSQRAIATDSSAKCGCHESANGRLIPYSLWYLCLRCAEQSPKGHLLDVN